MVMSGLWMSRIVAVSTSERLCGGMFVAMPTAMPPEPLTSRFGNFAGNTVGSRFDSSYVGMKSTVSLLMSSRSSAAIRDRRDSVYR